MDKAIGNLTTPLEHLKEEILVIHVFILASHGEVSTLCPNIHKSEWALNQ
jgi:hypothetical protein